MKYRELIGAVLRGEHATTCPVAFWQHHPVADQQEATLVEATLAFQELYDCDWVKITPASTFQVRDYGVTDAWKGDSLGRRWIGPGIIREPEDWARLPSIHPGEGFLGRHLRCARELRRRIDPAVPVLQSVFNPVFQASVIGGAAFAGHLETCPEAVEAGLRRISENTVRLVEALANEGVDGIYLVSQHAREGGLSRAVYDRFGWPSDALCLEAARAMPFVSMFHLHGDVAYLPAPERFPRCVLHLATEAGNHDPGRWLDLERRWISTGPGQNGRIRQGTPGEAGAEVREVKKWWKGPGFLLGAGCVLPLDTPEANIHAAIAAAREPDPDRPTASPGAP